MPLNVIGLNYDMAISSAALIVDGELKGAVAEERLSRVKRTKEFPYRAIKTLLESNGLSLDQIDLFCSAYNPAQILR